jgi:hypothetical protein
MPSWFGEVAASWSARKKPGGVAADCLDFLARE